MISPVKQRGPAPILKDYTGSNNMTNRQLIFSLSIGGSLLATGVALATGGLADWGLFWTGAIISTLSVTALFKEREFTVPILTPQLLPAINKAEL